MDGRDPFDGDGADLHDVGVGASRARPAGGAQRRLRR